LRFRLDALAFARASTALVLVLVNYFDGVERDGYVVTRIGFAGWITLLAGALLALITLFTDYSHVDFFWGSTLPHNQQIGVSLLLASLATLAADAQLASRRRSRD
jgi:hypothetical protein